MTTKRFEYEEFCKSVEIIAQNLKDKNFDAIIFAARGGAFLAQALAYALNIRDMYAINCAGYSGQTKLKGVKLAPLPRIEPRHKNLLFVDEIVDSGETLKAILEAFDKETSDLKIFTVALFERPTAIAKADYSLYETDEWIEFFWEDFEA